MWSMEVSLDLLEEHSTVSFIFPYLNHREVHNSHEAVTLITLLMLVQQLCHAKCHNRSFHCFPTDCYLKLGEFHI